MMTSPSADPVALVTGAASGIGAATVARLVADGIRRLALVDRDGDGLARLAARHAGTEILPLVHDVADPQAWAATGDAVGARFGRLDRAVVNAGIAAGGAIVDTEFDAWRRLMSVNLDGAFLTLRTAMRLMRSGGAIVVVASATAIRAEPGTGAYGASKAGLLQLARVAAREGAADGIRVNTVLPGGVTTPIWRDVPFFRDLVATEGSEDAAFDAMARMATPLGRFARPDEIAAQIAWLLSDAAAIMTGATITMDGGYTA